MLITSFSDSDNANRLCDYHSAVYIIYTMSKFVNFDPLDFRILFLLNFRKLLTSSLKSAKINTLKLKR